MARAKPRTHTFSWLGLSQVPHSGTSEMARAKPRTQLAPHTSDLFLPPAGGVCVCKPLDTRGFGFFHFSCTNRGMEKTYEAPSNEAPHMILGYHQGRLMTYLFLTMARG